MPSESPTLPVDNPNFITISKKTTTESKPFIGQWNTLVSTTNWDKGQIICLWRKQLEHEGVKANEYSDEAWSQLVGGVTPQHVGRLRRCYDRFGHVFGEYNGIFWSHFYAALDWDDAEMWLEGAVQNKWSVSGMRKERWETNRPKAKSSQPKSTRKLSHFRYRKNLVTTIATTSKAPFTKALIGVTKIRLTQAASLRPIPANHPPNQTAMNRLLQSHTQ